MHWEDLALIYRVYAWIFIIWISACLISLVAADDYYQAKVYIGGCTAIFLCLEGIVYLFVKALENEEQDH